jgi:hypothetical protein
MSGTGDFSKMTLWHLCRRGFSKFCLKSRHAKVLQKRLEKQMILGRTRVFLRSAEVDFVVVLGNSDAIVKYLMANNKQTIAPYLKTLHNCKISKIFTLINLYLTIWFYGFT